MIEVRTGPAPSEAETEEERLRQLMTSPVARQALALGLDASRVKMALRQRLRTVGSPFQTARELVDAAFGVHREQEDRAGTENDPSPAAFQRGVSTPALMHIGRGGQQQQEQQQQPELGPQSMDFEVQQSESLGAATSSPTSVVSNHVCVRTICVYTYVH